MKKLIFAGLVVVLFGCGGSSKGPDVSKINVTMKTARFDEAFFRLDTNNLQQGVGQLANQFPQLTPLFIQTIVGASDPSILSNFIRAYRPTYDSSQLIFKNFEPIADQIRNGFRHVKYYFPAYAIPQQIIPIVGPLESTDDMARLSGGDFIGAFQGPDFIGISLQFYLGGQFSFYQHEYFIGNVAPQYRSRRFSKEYIPTDVMKVVIDEMYPDNSSTLSLIEQMVEKGKRWWLLNKLLPESHDSLITGYTGAQVAWCNQYEADIWSQIVKTEKIRAIDPPTIQRYIGESPFTATLSSDYSPGNIGPWIGWQIIKKYLDGKENITPDQLMKTTASVIIDEAQYKPR